MHLVLGPRSGLQLVLGPRSDCQRQDYIYRPTAIAVAPINPNAPPTLTPRLFLRLLPTACAVSRCRSSGDGEPASAAAIFPRLRPAGNCTRIWVRNASIPAVPPSEKVRPGPVERKLSAKPAESIHNNRTPLKTTSRPIV